jgi:tetratricopeptide (TPR) repeat protein
MIKSIGYRFIFFVFIALSVHYESIGTPISNISWHHTANPQGDVYRQHIKKADAAFRTKNYSLALKAYNNALKIKPKDHYASSKIKEIEKILNKQHFTNAPYLQKIKEADAYFRKEEFQTAESLYREAIAMKPTEQYPKSQIKKIQKKQNELWKKNQIYDKTIEEADHFFEQKAWQNALIRYQDAKNLFPRRNYPIEKIHRIEVILENFEKIESYYQQAMLQGERLLKAKELSKAKESYLKALEYKPKDPIATQKLAEIAKLQDENNAERRKYALLIQKGDLYFEKKDFIQARHYYSDALKLLNKSYPRKKLNEINNLLRKENKNRQASYNRLIREGDNFFAGMMYLQAKQAYNRALQIEPSKKYPVQMIAKIEELLSNVGLRTLINSPTKLETKKVQKFSFEPITKSQRKNNFIYLKINAPPRQSAKVYLQFGSSETENGGYVIDLLPDEQKELIIPVGNRNSWFSNDNNWISFYSTKSGITLKDLKISRIDEDN